MRTINSIWIFAIVAATLCLSGCNGCNKQLPADALRYIPEQAFLVVALNPKNLLTKAEFAQLRSTENYKSLLEEVAESSTLLPKLLRNPDTVGIDLTKNLYAFAYLEQDKPVVGIVASINDATRLEALFNATGKPFKNSGKYNQATLSTDTSEEHATLAWTSELLLLLVTDSQPSAEAIATVVEPKSNSISSNASLRKSLKKNHDIMLWFESSKLAERLIAQTPELESQLSLAGLSTEALKGNTIEAFIQFEQGSMNGGLLFNLNKMLTKEFDPMFKDRVKTSFRKYLPSENLAAIISFGARSEGITDYLNKRGFAALLNLSLASMSLSLSDISAAFDGDMAVAIYPNNNSSTPQLIFATKINDKTAASKFIKAAVATGNATATADNTWVIKREIAPTYDEVSAALEAGEEIPTSSHTEASYLTIRDDILLLTNSEQAHTQMLKGGWGDEKTVAKDVYTRITEGIAGGYYNYSNYNKLIAEGTPGLFGSTFIGTSTQTINPQLYTDGYFHANRKGITSEIYLIEKKRSSLAVSLEAALEAYIKAKTSSQQPEEIPSAKAN